MSNQQRIDTNRAETQRPIDRAATATFLRTLDSKAEQWTFQTFDDNRARKDRKLTRLLHGTLAEHFETLAALNQRGAGVFVTVNETDGQGRTRENIVRIRAVWQEDDGDGQPLPLEPHLVVETSPNKYHRYLLAADLTANEHQRVQCVLVHRYGSDPSAKDIARVLRLPGFFHCKGTPFLARLIGQNSRLPYMRNELLAAFPESKPNPRPRNAPPNEAISSGDRNRTLTSLAGTMRRRGMSEAAIAAALNAENAARCQPPLDTEEVMRIARSITRYPAATAASTATAGTARDANEAKTEDDGSPRESVTDALVKLVRERAELFHDTDGRVYAAVNEDGHRETWALDSRMFHGWVSATFYSIGGRTPRESAIKDALHTLSGIGRFHGESHKVWLRAGAHEGRYFLDLANERWQVIEISTAGWRVLDDSPVRFRRTATMRPLSTPTPGGSLDALWEVLNVAEHDRPLVLAWILECWRPETHTPVLELGGEQGSGKSETQSRLRDLIDPSDINLRSAPAQLEHLFISAHNNWVVSLNNLSRLRRTEQDALCVLSTGGGFATRTLYSNAEETAFNTLRPVVMNGIAGLATSQDLVDRIIRVELPTLTLRRPSAELAREFEHARPALLGALLDLFSTTLRELPNVHVDDPPRMADFALLGEAMFRALGRTDRFVPLYRERQRMVSLNALESSPVACAVLALMESNAQWSGPAKALLERLARHRQDTEAWPRSPRGLGDALRRAVPALRLLGIDVHFDPVRRRDGYHITVSGSVELGDRDG